MPKAKNIAGKGAERASQGMPRVFMDRTRIRAEDAGVAVQESKRPRWMSFKDALYTHPPVVNINFFGGGGGSDRCGIRPYAALGDASWPGHGKPAPNAPTSRPTGPMSTPSPVFQELSDDSDDSKGKGKGQAKGDGKDKGKDPES